MINNITYDDLMENSSPIIMQFVDLLKQYSKQNNYRLFKAINKTIATAIYNDIENIRQTKKIDFNKFLNNKEITKIQYDNLLKFNKSINENGVMDLDVEDTFYKVIENVIIILESGQTRFVENENISTRGNDYDKANLLKTETVDIETVEGGDDKVEYTVLVPHFNFDYEALLINFFKKGRYIRYEFLEKLPLTEIKQTSSKIQKNKFELIGSNDITIMPIKYKMRCTFKNNDNIECGNVVEFCKVHMHSDIRCTDSLTHHVSENNRHRMKNINNAQTVDYVEVYIYTIKDLVGDDKKEKQIGSLVPITDSIIEANTLLLDYGADKQSVSIPLVLNYKPLKNINSKKLEGNILLKDKNNYLFTKDIYESLKQYLDTYHNIKINNSNRIVAEFIIHQILSNIYLDVAFISMILGKTGSGKTFFATILPKMFTNAISIIRGTSSTRTAILGGKSNLNSKLFNSTYAAGAVATNDLLIIEETGKILNSNLDERKFQEDTIIDILKDLTHKFAKYNIGTQGSENSLVRASTLLLGNFEDIKIAIKKYKSRLSAVYKSLTNGKTLPHYPLYKQIEYYMLFNEDLAKAHLETRKQLDAHYITGLDPANFSRIGAFIVLDYDKEMTKEEKKKRILETNYAPLSYQPHKDEFVNELDKMFANKKIPITFLKKVAKLMGNYFYDERNNFNKFNGDEVSPHTSNAQVNMMASFLYLNKLYWGEKLDINNEDIEIIRYIERFNYNILTPKEAAMIKMPIFNDNYLDMNLVEDEYEDKKEDYIMSKITADRVKTVAKDYIDKEKGSIEIDDKGNINEAFGSLPNGEFDD